MFQRIVVGVNRADSAVDALHRAQRLAEEFGATLHIVTAYEPGAERARSGAAAPVTAGRADAEKFLERFAATMPISVETHALPEKPAAAILRVAEEIDADLVVVGNKGMKGLGRVLGSVPNEVAHKANCSVLIVNTT
ncbi:MAG TPA: universal stress protein [Acidimicrobiia bacterium]|nr:universal stress protein [Acidimicrobiia bacterium]